MLSLHRLRPVRTLFRANTTLQSVATPLDPPPHLPPSNVQPTSPGTSSVATSPALISKTKGRNRNRILHRPKISRALPRDWNRPLGVGVLPAYDEALKLIRKDSKALKGAMGKLRIAIGEAEKAALRDEAAIVAMKEKLQIVEVQSEINLPDVRWKFANGMGALA